MLKFMPKNPKEIIEPSENGKRIEIRCQEQMQKILSDISLAERHDASDMKYMIVLLDDNEDLYSIWAVGEADNDDEIAWPLFPSDKMWVEDGATIRREMVR